MLQFFGKQHRRIRDYAFKDCSSLQSVSIPANVTSIGKHAFSSCDNLSLVEFCNGSTELKVGSYAFAGTHNSSISLKFVCSRPFTYDGIIPNSYNYSQVGGEGIFDHVKNLTEVVIGPNIVTIPDHSFYCSGLKKLSFSNATSLKTIGIFAFYNTELTEVVVPMGVTDIMSGAFRNCNSLKKACLYGHPTIDSSAFSSWTELDYGYDLTYDEWLSLYGDDKSLVTDLFIPNDDISKRGYTSTENLNTVFPNLKKVVFGEKVTALSANIFSMPSYKTNNIETIVFEGNPVDVGSSAFYYNTKLAKIEGKVKSVSTSSFSNCSSLESIEITGDDIVDASAFSACSSLKSVTLPNTLTAINQYAFNKCTSLMSIEIPSNVTSINVNAFYNATNLKTVTINSASIANPSTAYTTASNLATRFPNATGFKFGEGVSVVGKNALYGCARMTSLELPVSLTTINDNAFSGCTGLTSVTLPKNLTNMSASAFSGCTNVTNLTIASNTIASKTWTSTSNMNTIFPNLKKVVFGENVKAIGEYAFSVPSDKTNNIETIVFEGNPVDVGSSAFRYNTKLAKIGKVKSVGASSFSNCSRLESIEITGGETVGASAFSACSSLKSVTLPNTLTTINQYAFKDCIGLTSIEIPSNVTSINVEAFRTATNLTKVKISSASVVNPSTPYSETRNLGKIFPYATEVDLNLPMGNNNAIGNYAFYGATALKSIIRATKVTEIGANAFKGCTNLVLGDDRYFINTWGYVQTIGESAFEGCTSLKFDELTKNVTTINAAAFKGCTGLTSLILPEKLLPL